MNTITRIIVLCVLMVTIMVTILCMVSTTSTSTIIEITAFTMIMGVCGLSFGWIFAGFSLKK